MSRHIASGCLHLTLSTGLGGNHDQRLGDYTGHLGLVGRECEPRYTCASQSDVDPVIEGRMRRGSSEEVLNNNNCLLNMFVL